MSRLGHSLCQGWGIHFGCFASSNSIRCGKGSFFPLESSGKIFPCCAVAEEAAVITFCAVSGTLCKHVLLSYGIIHDRVPPLPIYSEVNLETLHDGCTGVRKRAQLLSFSDVLHVAPKEIHCDRSGHHETSDPTLIQRSVHGVQGIECRQSLLGAPSCRRVK